MREGVSLVSTFFVQALAHRSAQRLEGKSRDEEEIELRSTISKSENGARILIVSEDRWNSKGDRGPRGKWAVICTSFISFFGCSLYRMHLIGGHFV
jgi:hypothetical protein